MTDQTVEDKTYGEVAAEALGRSWGLIWRGMVKSGMPRLHATWALCAYIVSNAIAGMMATRKKEE